MTSYISPESLKMFCNMQPENLRNYTVANSVKNWVTWSGWNFYNDLFVLLRTPPQSVKTIPWLLTDLSPYYLIQFTKPRITHDTDMLEDIQGHSRTPPCVTLSSAKVPSLYWPYISPQNESHPSSDSSSIAIALKYHVTGPKPRTGTY